MTFPSTYWKCPHCHGTGKVIGGYHFKTIEPCVDCDGSGNAFVDGRAAAYRRRLAEIEENSA